MQKKAVRVAIVSVLVVVIFHAAQTAAGITREALLLLGTIALIYAIVDLFSKRK